MGHHAALLRAPFNEQSFQHVTCAHVLSALMSLMDKACMEKDAHVTGLTLLRKVVESENKQMTTPAVDWKDDEYEECAQIMQARQNELVDIGCVEFLCEHIQEADDADIR
jgi:hypothetical protein